MINHLYSVLWAAHCGIKEKLDVLLEVLSVNKKIGPPLFYLGQSLKEDKERLQEYLILFCF